MSSLLFWLSALLSTALALPALLFFAQVASAFLLECRSANARVDPLLAGMATAAEAAATDRTAATETRAAPETRGAPRVAILVPAHNEAAGLARTLHGFLAAMREGDRLLVVADNCSDATAGIARALGAEVVERFDDTLRGKSYALAAGVEYLSGAPPEQVLILDADCRIDRGFIATMAELCGRHAAPVQALYLMQAPIGDRRPATCFAEFAWRIKNWVRPLGGRRLGIPCALQGSGMIFPWSQLRAANIANGQLSEDYTLGLDLVRDGHAPRFTDAAVVLSEFPTSLASRMGQRRRWEHGHLDLITRTAPALLRDAVLRGRPSIAAAALDLIIPPLALLAALTLLALAVAGITALFTGHAGPLLLSLGSATLLGVALLLAWQGWGAAIMPVGMLLRVPAYALGKMSLYSRYVSARERQWKRTDRE